MNLKPILPKSLLLKSHDIWMYQWMLLTCGDFSQGDYNTMTVGWGSFGTMWQRPFAQVVVRPSRYTYDYIEKYDTFTLCAFPKQYRQALNILGTKSGRYGDKISEAGLTSVASQKIAAPAFAEAELIIECKKIYWQDMHPDQFIDQSLDNNYGGSDYHRIYFGEMIAIQGISTYEG